MRRLFAAVGLALMVMVLAVPALAAPNRPSLNGVALPED